MYCWSTAPTAVSEASVMRQVGAFGLGWLRSVALARASFVLLKADEGVGLVLGMCQ